MLKFHPSAVARWTALALCLIFLPLPSLRGDDKSVCLAFRTQYEPHSKDLWDFYSHFTANIVNTQFSPMGRIVSKRWKRFALAISFC